MTLHSRSRHRRTPSGVPAALLGAVLLVLVVVLVGAGTSGALAHTSLVTSTPGDAQRVSEPPALVTLEFAEPVAAAPDAVSVRDGNGVERATDVLVAHTGRVVSVVLDPDGAPGAWTARYEVRGSDGHVIAGRIDFAVAAPAGVVVASGPVLPALTATVVVGATAAAGFLALVLWVRRRAALTS